MSGMYLGMLKDILLTTMDSIRSFHKTLTVPTMAITLPTMARWFFRKGRNQSLKKKPKSENLIISYKITIVIIFMIVTTRKSAFGNMGGFLSISICCLR
jgi:hypothetical protein